MSNETRPAGSASRFVAAIYTLNEFCFRGAFPRYTEVTGEALEPTNDVSWLSPEKRRTFVQCVNWSLTVAENLIISLRLRVEAERRDGTFKQEGPYSFDLWMAMLRDYADAIAWTMLDFDLSAARSYLVGPYKHSDLIEHNWESVDNTLAFLNSDPDRLALATDLTSFIQVGDILLHNSRDGSNTVIEVKAGDVNGRVLDVLSADSGEEREERMQHHLGEVHKPEHFAKQVARSVRQLERRQWASEYREGDDKRRDAASGEHVRIREIEVGDQSWDTIVRSAVEGLEERGLASGLVDGCLYFEYAKTPHTKARQSEFVAHASRELGISEVDVVPWDVAHNLGTPGYVPQSISLMALGEDCQSGLLALHHSLLVAIGIDRLARRASENGAVLTVVNMSQAEQAHRSPFLTRLLGPNKIMRVNWPGQGVTGSIIGALVGRILFNFEPPHLIAVPPEPVVSAESAT
jgi:hypothetical protein